MRHTLAMRTLKKQTMPALARDRTIVNNGKNCSPLHYPGNVCEKKKTEQKSRLSHGMSENINENP